MAPSRIGFFTRVLDNAPAPRRYALALEQIKAAEALGYDTAWVAQHHFNPREGGLPSPFPFLAHAAAHTSRIRLGTGVVTLPMEDPLRMAEDAVVTDILSEGRLEVGFGSGGTPATFQAFGRAFEDRRAIQAAHMATVKAAWAGEVLPGEHRIWPEAGDLVTRSWQATFSVSGGTQAGSDGDGLMLSRTQPRPTDNPMQPLHEMQLPIVDAYLAALPSGVAPRIMASRTVFVADDRAEALRLAEIGLRDFVSHARAHDTFLQTASLAHLIEAFDVHLGTPEEVIESLARDPILPLASEVAVQVHSIDPPPAVTLRSIELFATRVAPAMGWRAPIDANAQSISARTA